MNPLAFDHDFREEGKAHLIIRGAEFLDLVVRARLLLAKLVGGEGKHFESLVLIFLVDLLQSLVLRCETALAGSIDDQEHFSLEPGQGDLLALDVLHIEVEHG